MSIGIPLLTPSDANPAMDSAASPGTSLDFARADHVHPSDTSREVVGAAETVREGLESHTADRQNPHFVTSVQVGLGNVSNNAQVKRTEMGTANGVATLDSSALIPVNQLPTLATHTAYASGAGIVLADPDVYIGGGADADCSITFDTSTNDGVLHWLRTSKVFRFDGSFQVNGKKLILSPYNQQTISAATDVIAPEGAYVILNATTSVTLTSTPTIAAGVEGQVLILQTRPGVTGVAVTLQDADALSGSTLQLGAVTRTVSNTQMLALIYNGTYWAELFYASN